MIAYRTAKGVLIEDAGTYHLVPEIWHRFINDDDILSKIEEYRKEGNHITESHSIQELKNAILTPIDYQEIWASGVTYYRSRDARMEESKEAGGGDFYSRVYDAERPELFFKASPHRTVGPGQQVRIRKDSKWNVPEPELTLCISSTGKIIGYTCGNDMSSRDIEGENPLYLPQAKSYDRSAAIGPGVFITDKPLPSTTRVELDILRGGESVFSDKISITQIKRKFEDLVGYLYRECSFPYGSYLMTGTGIVPPNEFTLRSGDEIRITIEPIGTLINTVE